MVYLKPHQTVTKNQSKLVVVGWLKKTFDYYLQLCNCIVMVLKLMQMYYYNFAIDNINTASQRNCQYLQMIAPERRLISVNLPSNQKICFTYNKVLDNNIHEYKFVVNHRHREMIIGICNENSMEFGHGWYYFFSTGFGLDIQSGLIVSSRSPHISLSKQVKLITHGTIQVIVQVNPMSNCITYYVGGKVIKIQYCFDRTKQYRLAITMTSSKQFILLTDNRVK